MKTLFKELDQLLTSGIQLVHLFLDCRCPKAKNNS